MKRLRILVLLILAINTYAQTDKDRTDWVAAMSAESKLANADSSVLKHDFAPLWVRLDDNASVVGYVGTDFQRMRIVILSATKSPSEPGTYNVTGKSMVKNVVRPFSGTMKITKTSSTPKAGDEEEYKGENVRGAGAVFGEYHFVEDAKQTSTGKFDGSFVTYWILDANGKLQYDEVMMGADAYLNNQFAGTWTSHRSKASKPASWGDSRIPVAGGLDIGAAEFSPEQKYIKNGWQNYVNAYAKQNERAMAEERRQWWK